MDELERKKLELKEYEEALTKLDSLDPKTKALVLEAMRTKMFEIRDIIGMIERNRSQSYLDSETITK